MKVHIKNSSSCFACENEVRNIKDLSEFVSLLDEYKYPLVIHYIEKYVVDVPNNGHFEKAKDEILVQVCDE